ncbi:MAG: DUF4139 domain-containing protein [Sulfitobacter sp.]
MRYAFVVALSFACPASADIFTLDSAPTSVTVYPYGAQVTREIRIDVPAGVHDLIIPDLPENLRSQALRVSLEGAALGTTTLRAAALPPQPDNDSEAIAEARALIKTVEAQLHAKDDEIAAVQNEIDAAEAEIRFLAGLGDNEGLQSDVGLLRDLAKMIGAETLAALQQSLTAKQNIDALTLQRDDIEDDLADARAALAALTPRPKPRAQLTMAVNAEAAQTVTATVTYRVEASWRPTYDIYLTQKGAPSLSLRRGVVVAQYSGENWRDVALTLSTLTPSQQSEPSTLFPIPLRIEDPQEFRSAAKQPLPTSGLADAILETPVVMAEAATASFDGPGVTYSVTRPVTIANGVEDARIPLDTLDFEVETFARAVPIRDETAFLIAQVTNTTQEPLLPSDAVLLYVDNALVGQSGGFDLLPAGAEAELSFGPIEGLRLTRTVLDRTEGDRGLINRTNLRSEEVRIDVQNLTDRDYDMRLSDQVPFSEQEDLEITWDANPRPDLTDVDDLRGILQWNLDVAAGSTASISMTQDIRWPEDKVLR